MTDTAKADKKDPYGLREMADFYRRALFEIESEREFYQYMHGFNMNAALAALLDEGTLEDQAKAKLFNAAVADVLAEYGGDCAWYTMRARVVDSLNKIVPDIERRLKLGVVRVLPQDTMEQLLRDVFGVTR